MYIKKIRSRIRKKLKKYVFGLILEENPHLFSHNVDDVTVPHDSENVKQLFPPGNFYSPIPDLNEVSLNSDSIFSFENDPLGGIDINEDEQIQLLNKISRFNKDIPFKYEKIDGIRYRYNNDQYSYTDAIFLFSMIRHLKPKKIIEIGSGWSSCVMLDTNELFMNRSINLTFIEPYPNRLYENIKDEDSGNCNIVEKKVQDVDLDMFGRLEKNDILFIDSTHVSKVGSDVNHIYFKILPLLKKGVWVHIHDVFYPFEYSKEWIMEGRAWNEDYILRAFLMFNNTYKIKLFSDYLKKYHIEKLEKCFPLSVKNTGGNIWLEKV